MAVHNDGDEDELVGDDYLVIDIPAQEPDKKITKLCCPKKVQHAFICKAMRDAMAGSQVPWIMYVFTTLCAFFLTLFVTERGNTHTAIYPDFILIFLMGVGFLVQLVCLLRKNDENFVNFGRLGHLHSNTYLMAGVYVFGTGALVSIALKLQIYYHAYEAIIDCNLPKIHANSMEVIRDNMMRNMTAGNSTNFDGYCQTEVAYDIARACFTLIQIFFMQTFRTATFSSSGFVKFTLYHTIVANGCIWLKYVLNETNLFRKSDHVFNGFDDITTSAWHTEEFMTPFILEYSLIAAGILQSISSQMQSLVQNMAHNDGQNGQGAVGNVAPLNEGEIAPAPVPEHQVSHKVKPAGSQPGLILGAVCGVILVTASLTFKNPETEQSRRSHNFFLAYEGLLAFFQIVVLYLAFQYLQKHDRFEYETRADDTLLFLGFIGIFSFHCLTMVSVCLEFKTDEPNDDNTVYIITIIHLLVLLAGQILQTFLIILSRRYKACTVTRDQRQSCGKIRQCCLFLLTTNLGFWALDTFVEMKDSATSSYPSGPAFFGSDWATVTSLTYPFVVFFRFHSAAMLYEFCSRFDPKDIKERKEG